MLLAIKNIFFVSYVVFVITKFDHNYYPITSDYS